MLTMRNIQLHSCCYPVEQLSVTEPSRNGARMIIELESHRTSKSWTSSFCKRFLNNSEFLHRFISSGRKSCTFFFVGVGRVFDHAALRHALFCGSEHACREVSSMQNESSTFDRDVMSSSIDFAISTSLIQCIVR